MTTQWSEDIDELATALAKAQGEIKAAAKSKANPFFKSMYADLSAIMEVCRTPLSANNLAIIQVTCFDPENIWLETTLIHKSGQWVRSRYPLRPTKDDPQGLGSALTYARRYSLAAMVGVVADDEDDDGSGASREIGENAEQDQADDGKQKTKAQAAAIEWAKAAIEDIRACKDNKELLAWEDKNAKTLVKLHKAHLASHGEVVAAIQMAQDKFNPLGA